MAGEDFAILAEYSIEARDVELEGADDIEITVNIFSRVDESGEADDLNAAVEITLDEEGEVEVTDIFSEAQLN